MVVVYYYSATRPALGVPVARPVAIFVLLVVSGTYLERTRAAGAAAATTTAVIKWACAR